MLTALRPRRAEILVSFSPLNKYSFGVLTRDGSVLKLSTHCRVLFPCAPRYNSKPKILVSLVLVARSFYPHKLFCAEPHNCRSKTSARFANSFQGALPSGDWVFNVVEYPSHMSILSRPRIKSRPFRTRL